MPIEDPGDEAHNPKWRRPASVLDSGLSEVRDRIAASGEPKLRPDLLISPKQPPPLPREQEEEEKEEVERNVLPDLCPATRAPRALPRPQAWRTRSGPAAPAASARRLPGRLRPGPARPRVRRCPRAGAPGRPRRCAVPGPGRRPPWGRRDGGEKTAVTRARAAPCTPISPQHSLPPSPAVAGLAVQ